MPNKQVWFKILLIKLFHSKYYFPSCLRAIRVLQKNGHVPSDPALFKSYAEYGHFVDIRIAALEAVVDYTKGTAWEVYVYIILERNVYYLKPVLVIGVFLLRTIEIF